MGAEKDTVGEPSDPGALAAVEKIVGEISWAQEVDCRDICSIKGLTLDFPDFSHTLSIGLLPLG